MKIDFGGTPLCTALMIDSPKGFNIKNQRLVQTSEPLRAVQAVKRSRKNVQTEITFSITRSHGTVQAAETFSLNHWASLPESGTLTMTSDDGSGRQTAATYIANAVLVSADTSYNGMLTMTSYVFEGGQPTSTKP